MDLIIRLTPDDHDSNFATWLDGSKRVIGSGYQGKEDGRLHVVRCPHCQRENYALAVAGGPCAWCGFDPNPARAAEGSL